MSVSRVSAFVGEDRQRLLEELVNEFHAVQRGGRSRLIALVAPTGWGKTRVVQELYAQVVAESGGGYWPARLGGEEGSWLQARKRIFPAAFQVEEEVDIPLLWLGVSCQRDQIGRHLAALQYAEHQFQAHVGPMAAALADRGERWKDRLGALGAVAGLLGLPDPVTAAMSWHDTAKSGWEFVSEEWESFRSRRDAKRERRIDADGDEQEQDRATELAAQIAVLSGDDLPVVIIVDDAHWADPGTVRFVTKVLATPGQVLVVATSWPDQLAVQAGEVGTFGHGLDGWLFADWAIRRDLDKLEPASLRQLVEEVAADPDPRLLDALCDRADGNPNRLQGLMSLRVVRRALATAGAVLTEGQIDELPTGDRDIYAAIWRDLPENVREVLALSTVQGPEFNPDWIPAAGELLDLADVTSGVEEARAPWGWVRSLDAALDAFVEAGLYERAEEESRTLFLPDELASARAAMLKWAVALKGQEAWHELSVAAKRAVLEAHYQGAEEGFLPIDDDVLDSVDRLLHQLQDTSEHARQHEVATRGLEWVDGRRANSDMVLRFRFRQAEATGWLGRAGEAAELFRGLLQEHALAKGEEDYGTHLLRSELGFWLSEAGRLEEAIRELRYVIKTWTNRFGEGHWITRRARTWLGGALEGTGQFEEAIEHLQAVYDERNAELGPENPLTVKARYNLATCRGEAGQWNEALTETEQVLEIRSRLFGPDDPATLSARNGVGRWLLELGRGREALVELESTLAGRVRVSGPDDPETLITQGNLAGCLLGLERFDEAAEAFRALLGSRERVLGPDDPRTMATKGNLAVAVGDAGNHEEAIELHRQVLDQKHRVLGGDNPDTLTSRHGLATQLGVLDRFDEAALQFELLVEDRARVLGEEHPLTVLSASNLAYCLWHGDRLDEAGPIFERVVEVRTRTLGPFNPETLTGRRNLDSWRIGVARAAEDVDGARAALADMGRLIDDHRREIGTEHPATEASTALYEEIVEELRADTWFPDEHLPRAG